MLSSLFKPKFLSFVLILFILEIHAEQGNAEFSVRRSSQKQVAVAQGQPLRLNITLNGTVDTMPMLVFLDWNFRAYNSRVVKRLLSVTWDRGFVVSEEFYDERVSIIDSASLFLVDVNSRDSGTYWCNVFSLPSQHYPVLYFNVTVQGSPVAELGCPENANVTLGKNFSCWCNARSSHLAAKTTWQMEGSPPFLDAKRRNGSVELFLQNVDKRMTGVYICRAQLHSMLDEKRVFLSVFYRPTIRSFRAKVLKQNSMKVICQADGLPRPTYVIKISNGLSFAADIDGAIVIDDYESIMNESYVCIARNSVGEDKWRLNGILTLSKDEPGKNRKSFLQNYVWYIIGGSAIAGILLGFFLFKVCQSGVCKKSQQEEQSEQDSPVYVDPATLPMSQGCNKDPLNYIDVHVLPTIPPGGVKENMPIYVDPDTVVSSREKLRENRGEVNQAFGNVQAEKPPEDDNRVYQAPQATRAETRVKTQAETRVETRAETPVETRAETRAEEDAESEIEDDQEEEEKIQANSGSEASETNVPFTQRKPRANTEPMMGYQDLDSSDEIEENFYHSLHTASKGESKTIYYVNEKVLSSSFR